MSASLESVIRLPANLNERSVQEMHFVNHSGQHIAAKFQTNSTGLLQITPTAAIVRPGERLTVRVLVNPIENSAILTTLAIRTVFTLLTQQEADEYGPQMLDKKQRAACRHRLFSNRQVETFITRFQHAGTEDVVPDTQPAELHQEDVMHTAEETSSQQTDSADRTPPAAPPTIPEVCPEPAATTEKCAPTKQSEQAPTVPQKKCARHKRWAIRVPVVWIPVILLATALIGRYAV